MRLRDRLHKLALQVGVPNVFVASVYIEFQKEEEREPTEIELIERVLARLPQRETPLPRRVIRNRLMLVKQRHL